MKIATMERMNNQIENTLETLRKETGRLRKRLRCWIASLSRKTIASAMV